MTRRAFTLLEVALVIGILTTLLFLTLIVATGSIGRSALRTTENILVQSIRRTQVLAQNAVQGKNWGIYICPGPTVPTECRDTSVNPNVSAFPSIIIFMRTAPTTTFDEYRAADDQTFEINPNIAFSGPLYTNMTPGADGLWFTKINGTPVTTPESTASGTITFSFQGEERSIVMSGKGVVEH